MGGNDNMMHRPLGSIHRTKNDKFEVILYNNRTKDVFPTKKEAIKFAEGELTNIVNNYDFSVCYKYVDEIDHKVSYVLLDKLKKNQFEKYELTKYEYVKTHFFYFNKDERRKIIDWKNPDFQQMTRHSLSSKRLTHWLWLSASFLAIIFTVILLAMFGNVVNTMERDLDMLYIIKPSGITTGVLMALLIIGLMLMVVVAGIYIYRMLRYNMLVHSGSKWHEDYSHVDWRHYERVVAYTNWVTLALSIAFGSLIITFAALYAQSPIAEAAPYYSQINAINYIIFPTAIFFGLNMAGSAYYIYRFHAEIAILKKRLLTKQGQELYDHWLKHNDVSPKDMRNAFHPIDDHAIYPATSYPKENDISDRLSDEEIEVLLHVTKHYENLIIKQRFGKHYVEEHELKAAKEAYLSFQDVELKHK